MFHHLKFRILPIMSLLVIAFAAQIISAKTLICSTSVDANSPEWLAVRQQYEPGYIPPHLREAVSQTVDANSPEWLAIRQQYETTYMPPTIADANAPAWLAVRQQFEVGFVASIDPTFRPIVDANSPEWLAVRQQYETTYVPPSQIEVQKTKFCS